MKLAIAVAFFFAVVVLLTVMGIATYNHNKRACEHGGGVYQRKPDSKIMECVHR